VGEKRQRLITAMSTMVVSLEYVSQ
jgi:hypothetical protein